MIGLAGSGIPFVQQAAIAFFGIRGVGSIYYLAYALDERDFRKEEYLWSIIGWVILASIVIHGVTAAPAMRRIDRD